MKRKHKKTIDKFKIIKTLLIILVCIMLISIIIMIQFLKQFKKETNEIQSRYEIYNNSENVKLYTIDDETIVKFNQKNKEIYYEKDHDIKIVDNEIVKSLDGKCLFSVSLPLELTNDYSAEYAEIMDNSINLYLIDNKGVILQFKTKFVPSEKYINILMSDIKINDIIKIVLDDSTERNILIDSSDNIYIGVLVDSKYSSLYTPSFLDTKNINLSLYKVSKTYKSKNLEITSLNYIYDNTSYVLILDDTTQKEVLFKVSDKKISNILF